MKQQNSTIENLKPEYSEQKDQTPEVSSQRRVNSRKKSVQPRQARAISITDRNPLPHVIQTSPSERDQSVRFNSVSYYSNLPEQNQDYLEPQTPQQNQQYNSQRKQSYTERDTTSERLDRAYQAYTNYTHREFISKQPEKLRQMVISKSKAALSMGGQQNMINSEQQRSLDGRSATENNIIIETKADNIRNLNKKNVFKNQFMKNRIKKYCADSGLPTQEEIQEYQRLQFLKDVERNMKYIELGKGQQEIQLVLLKTIEETPLVVPHSKHVQEQIDVLAEKMSLRVPKLSTQLKPDQPSSGNKQILMALNPQIAHQNEYLTQVRQNVKNRMGQISSMLNDMGVLQNVQSIFDDVKNDNQEEHNDLDLRDFDYLLQQKQMLREYCSQLKEIDKKQHRAYWETIKRVHAKLDKKMIRQRELDEQAALVVQEAKFAADRAKNLLQASRKKKKSKLQLAKEARLDKKERFDYKRKYGSTNESIYTDYDSESEEEKPQPKNDTFEKMHKRVLKKVNKRKVEHRIKKLLIFQKELIAQFDNFQLEQLQEIMDEKAINFEMITEEGMQELMIRKLNRQLSQIFLKTELFFAYHQELDMNLELFKMNKVSEHFVKERRAIMENKIKVHLKQLMPSLVGSADILASKSEGSSTLTAEEAYKDIKNQLKIHVRNSMMKSHYLKETQEIREMTTERSESSSYLETDSEDLGDQKELQTKINEKRKEDLLGKTTAEHLTGRMKSIVRHETSLQKEAPKVVFEDVPAVEGDHAKRSMVGFRKGTKKSNEIEFSMTTMQNSESFKPSMSFRSKSSNKSIADSVNLKNIEGKLEQALLRQKPIHRRHNSQNKYQNEQQGLLNAFSKTIARNLQNSIEKNEKEYQKRMAKQLVKKANFGQNFSLSKGNGKEEQDFDLDQVVNHYQLKQKLESENEYQEKFSRQKQKRMAALIKMQMKFKHKGRVRPEAKQILENAATFESEESSVESIEEQVQKNKANEVLAKLEKKRQTLVTTKLPDGHLDIRNLVEEAKEKTVQNIIITENKLHGVEVDALQIKARVKQMLSYDMSNAKRNLPQNQQQLLSEAKKISKESSTKTYVNNVIKVGGVPLPILNKIQKKFLILQDYAIEEINFNILVDQMPNFIPNSLQKILLMRNKLNDASVAKFFNMAKELPNGPKVIAIIQNTIGALTLGSLSDFMSSSASGGLTKLIIKDPIFPNNKKPQQSEQFTKNLIESGKYLYRLKELVLQGIGLNKNDVAKISEFCTVVHSIKLLSVSGNGLRMSDFITMFDILRPSAHSITHIDFSWNSMTDEGVSQSILGEFCKKFSDFMRYSLTLQHINLSGVGFSIPTLKYLTDYGFRKSKTLLAIHMDGNFKSVGMLDQFRLWMKVVKIERDLLVDDSASFDGGNPTSQIVNRPFQSNANTAFSGSRVLQKESRPNNPAPLMEMESIIRDDVLPNKINKQGTEVLTEKSINEIHDYRPFQHQLIKKQLKDQYLETMRNHSEYRVNEGTQKQKFVQAVKAGGLEANLTDRVVFQRFLGHYEILNGYRWHEVDDQDCFLCNNWSYCIFLLDKNLAKDEDIYYSVSTKQIGNVRPKSIFTHKYVQIDSIKKVLPMMSIQHFLSRLSANKVGGVLRILKDHEIEEEKEELKAKVDMYENKMRKQRKLQDQGGLIENYLPPKPLKWHLLLQKYLQGLIQGIEPQGTINLQNENMPQIFQSSCRDDSLSVCAAYLPPKMTSVIIQDQMSASTQVMFTEIFPTKFKKQPKKSTRKIEEVRKFNKANSVFKDWKEENNDLLRKQMEYDGSLNKLARFIKDPTELKNTYATVLKYYRPVRDQFFMQISTAVSYPVIDWIDFTNYCQIWSIVDNNLKVADIDRIFIATNVELDEQEGNDDRSLCRFEFYEIIVRMARTKYLESKLVNTMSEAYEKILVDHILPRAEMKFESVVWRETFLWTLYVDDLFKANMTNIKKVFDLIKRGVSNFIKFKDTLDYINSLPLQVHMDSVTLAFSFSKMQFVEELELIDNYHKLFFVEFLEFLGRLAFLLESPNEEHFNVKLWRLLDVMFGQFKSKVQDPTVEAEVDSESDYEDELASQILLGRNPEEMYAGFGVLKLNEEDDGKEKAMVSGGKAYHPNPYAVKNEQ